MGFQLGRALGKLAGTAVRTATRGLVRPTFVKSGAAPPSMQKPSIISTVPDSIVTTTQRGAFAGPVGFGSRERQVTYFGPNPIVQPDLGGGGLAASSIAGCPTGFRLNKSAYVTRGGGTSHWPAGLQLHEKGSVCVRRRKMNAGNGRAATHAVRRLVAFYRLSNRVAKQLRRAAAKAHIRGARRGQRSLPRGGGVEVVNVD